METIKPLSPSGTDHIHEVIMYKKNMEDRSIPIEDNRLIKKKEELKSYKVLKKIQAKNEVLDKYKVQINNYLKSNTVINNMIDTAFKNSQDWTFFDEMIKKPEDCSLFNDYKIECALLYLADKLSHSPSVEVVQYLFELNPLFKIKNSFLFYNPNKINSFIQQKKIDFLFKCSRTKHGDKINLIHLIKSIVKVHGFNFNKLVDRYNNIIQI